MNTKKIINTVILLVLTVFFMGSCSKNTSVAPQVKKLSYQFKVQTPSAHLALSGPVSAAGPSGTITWQSGYANVASISFEGMDQQEHQNEDVCSEPQVYKVDLFSLSQLIGNVDIAVVDYHHVDIKIELKKTPTDSALFLKGVYGSIPVELSLDEGNDNTEVIAIAKDLAVGVKDTYVSVINLHLDKLLTGVSASDLDSATLTNGTLYINSNSNPAIYSKILANLGNFSDGDYNN